jgi:hypothetical protein
LDRLNSTQIYNLNRTNEVSQVESGELNMKTFLDKSSVIGALVGIGNVLSANQVFADAISVLAF